MFGSLKNDLLASFVVFFVALPLCLGISVASGAPAFSGIIAGIVGGIVVGLFSRSSIGVSGPAAGLVVIVAGAISSLGFNVFLSAVVLAGGFQILLGLLRAGVIGYYFPSAVIKGMLSAIGILIFIRQFPDALGLKEPLSWERIGTLFHTLTPGVVAVTFLSLIVILVWDKFLTPKHLFFKLVPGTLIAVIIGIGYQLLLGSKEDSLFFIPANFLVNVPVAESWFSVVEQLSFPDFSQITDKTVWEIAVTLAVVASLESLLSAEASDKLDPLKRVTPSNRELIAQGIGNAISGLIGGVPITQVIVRSSANVMSGAKTKLSAIFHGVWLLLSVILIPQILNLIPMAVLASILLVIGFKLAHLSEYPKILKLGKSQFVPFITTVIAILLTDLLIGIMAGLTVGIIVILINNFKNSHFLHIQTNEDDSKSIEMTFAEEVTFLNKGAVLRELHKLPEGCHLSIDVRHTRYLDYDILEIFDNFLQSDKGKTTNITIKSERGFVKNPQSFRVFFGYETLSSH